MAAESKLQSRVHKHLSKNGWLVVKNMLMSRPGWPDTTALKDGRVVWLEIKDNKKLDSLQVYIFKMIREHGGEVYKVAKWDDFLALDLDSE
jgi:hypothetical protein